MEKDFHYYLIYVVSKITGFEKSEKTLKKSSMLPGMMTERIKSRIY